MSRGWMAGGMVLLLGGCGSGTAFSGLSEAELEERAIGCSRLSGSGRIMALACDEVHRECAYRNAQGAAVCTVLD